MASTRYNLTTSSSALTSPLTRWDVFLSFRGIDTRYTFTDYLYDTLQRTGIRTFRDDPELRSGEVISDALLQAIQESKTYVVVFSENYASSRWCLDELVEIFGCYKSMGRLVVPVFYNIEPLVVRHQTGSFNQAFAKHETRFDTDILAKWRVTLMNVANLSGYEVCKNMSQADIINKVVDRVLHETNPMTLDVAKYPVGLDSRVEDIAALLSSDSEGVIRIGIHGMGGVGKTTLAKAVYNQNYRRFHGSCFLANVREISGTEKGIVFLQQKLINNILKCKNITIDNVDQGIEVIRARICSKKVLIVIDDLDNSRPLEFLEGPFALRSIIIITTRNEDLLDSIKVEAKYKVNELGDAESRQLLTQHAFGDNKISDTFMELSEEILERAGGLPLALKVFGSNLLNQSEEGWRWFIDRLKRVSIGDVEKKLMISFDALKLIDPMLQNIFLDIACFFIRHKKEEVVKILETSYTFVNHNIDILKKRCLLTINDEDELGMHDLVQDMGRGIARNNSHEPGKHSRLWVRKDICDVLMKHEGTEAVEGIIHQNFESENAYKELSLTTETFKRMSKLRFLHLNSVKLSGSFERTLEELRWLSWNECPLKCLPSEFYPRKLVILELPHSEMRTMWEPNVVSRVFRKLKTLNMSYSQDLTTSPDFTKLPCLETLNLGGCKSLEEVHISIGRLTRLESLNLHGCVKLRSLPDTICNLRALKVLTIGECSSLEVMPKDLGNMESLTKLNADGLTVSRLPNSIGRLSKLVELKLRGSKHLETLPHTICNLRALEVLDIHDCSSLEALPIALGNIKSLKELNAEKLIISKLPDSIGHLSQLVDLTLNNNMNLKDLPDTICNLRSLEILDISLCGELEMLPDQLWKLTRLRKLNAGGATLLKKLPDIESSQIALSLQMLDLSECVLTALPSGISQLSYLEDLELSYCVHLLSIAEIPPNLKRITANDCTSMERLNLSNLKQLEILDVTNCSGLTKIQGLEEVASLRGLYLGGCNSSLLSYTLTESLFEIFSGFGNQIEIYIPSAEFPDWVSQSSNLGSTMSLDLLPNVSDDSDNILLEFTDSKDIAMKISLDWSPDSPIMSDNYLEESMDSISQSSDSESALSSDVACQKIRWSLNLPPNVSHNFLGLILCFNHSVEDGFCIIEYAVKNTTSDFVWNDSRNNPNNIESLMVIVPRSIFSVRDGDNRIELTANVEIHKIYLLYKTELQ